MADIAPYGNIKYVGSEQGTELPSSVFESLLIKNEINHQNGSLFSPHRNGTTEKRVAHFLKWPGTY